MSKVCALCDVGFTIRRNDDVPVKIVSIDGKPAPGTVLMFPKTLHDQIVAWHKETQDDVLTDD